MFSFPFGMLLFWCKFPGCSCCSPFRPLFLARQVDGGREVKYLKAARGYFSHRSSSRKGHGSNEALQRELSPQQAVWGREAQYCRHLGQNGALTAPAMGRAIGEAAGFCCMKGGKAEFCRRPERPGTAQSSVVDQLRACRGTKWVRTG